MDRKGEPARPLAGVRVALAETRELDRLATILEAEGALALRCPLVAILDAPDTAPVDAWLAQLAQGGFDDLIFLTGEGLRRLLARARRIDLYDQALAAIGRARKVTRGPKPARALHEVGLSTDLPAAMPTSQGVMEALANDELTGHRIGLQLYGTQPNEPLVRFLQGAGATVHPCRPLHLCARLRRPEGGRPDRRAGRWPGGRHRLHQRRPGGSPVGRGPGAWPRAPAARRGSSGARWPASAPSCAKPWRTGASASTSSPRSPSS